MSEEKHSASQVFFLVQLFAFPSFCPFSLFSSFFSLLSFIPCSYILVLHAPYRIGCLFPWEGYVWRQMEQEDFSRSQKSILWGPYTMCTGAWGAVYHYPFSWIPGKNGVSFLHKWTISSLCTDITVCAGLGEFIYKVSLWFEAPEREKALSIFLLWHLFYYSASILPTGQEVVNNGHSHWKLLFCWATVCVSVVSTYCFCVLQLEHHQVDELPGHRSLMMGKDTLYTHGPWVNLFTQLDSSFFLLSWKGNGIRQRGYWF